MSYKLRTVLDELEGGGMITTDDGLVVDTLNNDLGLNLYHSLGITPIEKQKLKNAITALQVLALSNADEFFEDLAEECLEVLKG